MNKFGFSCIYQCKDTNFKETNKVKVNVIGCIYQCKDTNFKVSYKTIKKEPGCIYQCKDTNFKANHNKSLNNYFRTIVVFTNAKILILKLITTGVVVIVETIIVVFTNAKILILKLITTPR